MKEVHNHTASSWWSTDGWSTTSETVSSLSTDGDDGGDDDEGPTMADIDCALLCAKHCSKCTYDIVETKTSVRPILLLFPLETCHLRNEALCPGYG